MEGGFQTNKEVEFEEEVAIVVLPSMQKIEVKICIKRSFYFGKHPFQESVY